MTDQLSLTGDFAQPDDLELGRAQRAVVAEMRRLDGQLTADEAGAVVHALRGKHGRDERCPWCARDGAQVLKSLKRRRSG